MLRPTIDAELVRRLIRAQFPEWADLPVSAVEPGGWDNRTFRLGPRLSVRLPSAERYAAQVEREHRWLPYLAPHLPLEVPVPEAIGRPGEGYPWSWSVRPWIEGETATAEADPDSVELATDLAGFLAALHRVDPAGGPAPGPHNFYRGGSLVTYDSEVRGAIAALAGRIDGAAATSAWEAALASEWERPPVWVHGDIAPGNLLLREGRLRAVIDFGQLGVGDPACDLAIAWAFFGPAARRAFRVALPLDDGTWARARGWSLWKSLINMKQR